MDEKGEVIRSHQAEQARVVSNTPIKLFEDPNDKEVDLNDLTDLLAEDPDKSVAS